MLNKRKTKRKFKKTKKQRQEWWYSLTPERQNECIKYWIKDKSEQRRQRSIRIMKNRKPKDCKKCIHGITKSCTDNLERGCEYHYKVA